MHYFQSFYGNPGSNGLSAWYAAFESGRLFDFTEHSIEHAHQTLAALEEPTEHLAAAAMGSIGHLFFERLARPMCGVEVAVGNSDPTTGSKVEIILRWIGGPGTHDVLSAVSTLFDLAPFPSTIVLARLVSDDELPALKAAVKTAWHVLPPAEPPESENGLEVWPPRWWSLTRMSEATLFTLCLDWLRLNVDPPTGRLLGPATPFMAPPYISSSHMACGNATARAYMLRLIPHFPTKVTPKTRRRADREYGMLRRGACACVG